MIGLNLQAGPLHMLYQHGCLRYVSHGDDEILRMIYFALRDEHWGTYPLIIENEKIDKHEKHFAIQYDGYHKARHERIYHWKVFITGAEDGQIDFEIKGTALADFLKNRAGFCVLHPVKGTAGESCEVIQTNGVKIHDSFPTFIAPHNPFESIKSMRWKNKTSSWLSLNFEGDIFETEDQRNWTDASFKTFCTPLEQLFPVQLKTGDTIRQCITFKSVLADKTLSDHVIRIYSTGESYKLPTIGICASSETDTLSEKAVALLNKLPLSHYRIDVHPDADYWVKKFSDDCCNALTLNLPLEVALHLTDNFKEEFQTFVILCQQNRIKIKQLLLLNVGKHATSQATIDFAIEVLRKEEMLETLVGAGTNFNFTEINRNRFEATGLDFISFSIHPQEHAFDDLTLTENIEGQSQVVSSARNIFGNDIQIHISPLTLRKRFNPYTQAQHSQMTNEQRADPRQKTFFGALFTLGSIRALTMAGAHSVSLFQTIGNQGIISDEGIAYPIYGCLKIILNDSQQLMGTESSDPLQAEALLLMGENHRKLILLNYTAELKTVWFDGNEFQLAPYQIHLRSYDEILNS